MKTDKIITIGFLLVVLILVWKTYAYFHPNFEQAFAENNQQFDASRKELNEIIKEINLLNIERKYELSEKEISIEVLPEELKNKLEDLGIKSFSIKSIEDGSCLKKNSIEFTIGEQWNIESLNCVKLIYVPCNAATKKNYHFYDGFHIDTWGQGEDWMLFSDTDFM